MDKISVPIVEGVDKKWKLSVISEEDKSSFEGGCRNRQALWSGGLLPGSNWGLRIYRSKIVFSHQCSASRYQSGTTNWRQRWTLNVQLQNTISWVLLLSLRWCSCESYEKETKKRSFAGGASVCEAWYGCDSWKDWFWPQTQVAVRGGFEHRGKLELKTHVWSI